MFSVMSWNVEHFGKQRQGEDPSDVAKRITRVFDRVKEQETDVIALYEVSGSQVFESARSMFPGHSWAISEGGGSQRILVGHRDGLRGFVTFRAEFSKGWAGPLRPGLLLSVHDDGEDYALLFLHLKAADGVMDFAVRDIQHAKARSLKRVLDGPQVGNPNFLVVGDLNNVGADISFHEPDIGPVDELKRLERMYGHHTTKMRFLKKGSTDTFWNGPGKGDPADLDHVAAADHLKIKELQGGVEVEVHNWDQRNDPAAWILDYSDHAMLKFTVTGVG